VPNVKVFRDASKNKSNKLFINLLAQVQRRHAPLQPKLPEVAGRLNPTHHVMHALLKLDMNSNLNL
jgi:hypothetical protein